MGRTEFQGVMLKSTHKSSEEVLPAGWTEHKAPTGHKYYYHSESKESTYTRPGPAQQPPPTNPSSSFFQYQSVPSLADPATANAFLAHYRARTQPTTAPTANAARDTRPKPAPRDRPISKTEIPGCEPWLLVATRYGRRFVHHPVKNTSFWRIPDKLKDAVLALDRARILKKVNADMNSLDCRQNGTSTNDAHDNTDSPVIAQPDSGPGVVPADHDSSEYEEIEVTDDEAEDAPHEPDSHLPSKRQKRESPGGPVEFSEMDIAFQLQAMGANQSSDEAEYDDGQADDWREGAAGINSAPQESRDLFTGMLDDLAVNPFSPWDRLLEEGKIIDDPRYTALSTTRARKEAWGQWSQEKIQYLKDTRARQEKQDPRISFLAFLQEKATPKLYWPEFRRKYQKEAPMKGLSLSDKDREKLYREHINRLKLPVATRKADLTSLLKSQPLHNGILLEGLPGHILSDIRFISLEPSVRGPLIEAYIQNRGPPPAEGGSGNDNG